MSRLGSARGAVWGWLRSVGPQRRYLGRDLLAGLPGAVGSVPDGMAAAILAGVNPVQGLYASFAGPITGGLTANTRLMVITTTSASALAAGSALSGVPAAQRPAAVPLVALIAGAALVAAGLAKLGRYTRFVSYSHLQARLSDPSGSHAPAVVLRLRGRTSLGATFLKVITGYAERLAEVDGRLYLSGLDPSVAERLRHTGRLKDPERIFEATPLVGESTEEARHAAQEWLVRKQAK